MDVDHDKIDRTHSSEEGIIEENVEIKRVNVDEDEETSINNQKDFSEGKKKLKSTNKKKNKKKSIKISFKKLKLLSSVKEEKEDKEIKLMKGSNGKIKKLSYIQHIFFKDCKVKSNDSNFSSMFSVSKDNTGKNKLPSK